MTQDDVLPTDNITSLLSKGLHEGRVGLMLFAPDDTILYRSATVVEMLGIPPSATHFTDIVRHCFSTGRGLHIETDDINSWIAMVASKRRSLPRRSFSVDLTDGRWLHLEETVLDGGVLFCTFVDITALKTNERMLRMAHDAAQQAALTDALTGLFNRRYASSRLEDAIAEATRDQSALTVAMIDLDHFKAINDQFGHEAGDTVLIEFAKLAKKACRAKDAVARMGGEEFLMIMPGATMEAALMVVERLHEAMQTLAFPGLAERRCTFSAGLSAYKGQDAPTLIRAADDALYRAKASGRNRSEVAR